MTREEELRIVKLRKKHLKYGKKKLQVLYSQIHGERISTWKIERVIRRHRLYPDKEAWRKRLKKRRQIKKKSKRRIQEVERPGTFGHLWHIDAIIIWWFGQRRVIFTALVVVSF